MRSAELTCPHCHHTIELSVQTSQPSASQTETPSIPIKLTPRAHVRVSSSSIPVFVSFPPEAPKALVRSVPPVIVEREYATGPIAILRSIASVAPETDERATDVSLEVTPESDHNFYVGFSSNISEGGLFVATHTRKEVGDTLSIRFTLPGDDEPIVALTEVRWVREYNECSDVGAGLGVRFVDLSDDARERIHAFCTSSREPLFYPEDSLFPPPHARTG